MDAAGPGALGAVRPDEAADLAHDVVEVAGLASGARGERVAVHRVAGPHHRMAGVGDRAQQWSQTLLHLVGTHPADQREPAGDAVRVEPFAQLEQVLGGGRRADLAAERVADAAEELDVRPVEFAGPLADPQHVGRAVEPRAGQRVLPGERLLVAEDQRLVGRVDVDFGQVGVRLDLDAAGPHEPERTVDLAGELFVPLAFRARRHELLCPRVHPGEVGETALGERPQQVQGRGRLVVRLHEAFGIRDASGFGRRRVVDDVAAERRQVDVADPLEVGRAGLGELPGDAADLHDRHADASRSARPPSAG